MRWDIDKSLLLVLFLFVGLGLVQVYSSSYIYAIETYDDGLYFFRRQLLAAAIGLVVITGTALIKWEWIEKWGVGIFFITTVGVALTLVPGLAIEAGGASRWVRLPFGLRFEPGEFLKVSLPLLLATWMGRDLKFLRKLKWPLLLLLVTIPLALVLRQPDFGTFAICVAVAFGTLFAFGLPWRYVFGGLVAAGLGFYFLVVNVPYRYARIQAFLDPWQDPSEKGFQIIQSLLSFHSGGLGGVGLGQGQGKLFFLPEAHTDFTLAVLGEEMGYIGFAIVGLLYGFVIWRGFQISFQSKGQFEKALALGLTMMIGLCVFINTGVALGLLPTKGLTLPFMSYGGSSLIATCFAGGLLLSVDRLYRLKYEKPFQGYDI